ncbi:MAG TPA: pyridoxal 5'-phosphate synthase glutaminase subunit PdxT [Candidatus Nanopelagicaceae bacterium]
MLVGVLALQGDFREHLFALAECGVDAIPVKSLSAINEIDALVLPGGESTTIAKLARTFGLLDRISERIQGGLPTYGSCAGMILLADRIEGGANKQESFGGMDITVRRYAFGRQVDSFEADLLLTGITGPAIRAIFIRAPWVESVGSEVEVLASIEINGELHPVAVRQGNLFATSFHTEITGDNRVHRYFIENVCKAAVA